MFWCLSSLEVWCWSVNPVFAQLIALNLTFSVFFDDTGDMDFDRCIENTS